MTGGLHVVGFERLGELVYPQLPCFEVLMSLLQCFKVPKHFPWPMRDVGWLSELRSEILPSFVIAGFCQRLEPFTGGSVFPFQRFQFGV